MAELSVDEAQRLARLFLTGQASDTEVSRLQNAIGDDQGAALELLAQMQAALDDSAPAGLSAEQDRSVNGRIEALIAPRVKKRGPFSFLFKLFRRKPKEEEAPKASRTRRRGSAPESAPAPEPEVAAPAVMALPEPASDDLGETLPGAGMEEMAPISAPAAAPVPAPAPEPAAASSDAPQKKALPGRLIPIVGVLLLLAAIGFGVKAWMQRPKAGQPLAAQVPVAPTAPVAPKPTPSSTPAGRARRAVAIAPIDQEPLPAEFKATTPIASGSSNINP